MNTFPDIVLKVSSSTDAQKLSKTIVANKASLQENQRIILKTIGAGSLNQAIKSCIIANKALVSKGSVINMLPAFVDLEEGGRTVTSIELCLKFVRV